MTDVDALKIIFYRNSEVLTENKKLKTISSLLLPSSLVVLVDTNNFFHFIIYFLPSLA
jgi:hypothetical protein